MTQTGVTKFRGTIEATEQLKSQTLAIAATDIGEATLSVGANTQDGGKAMFVFSSDAQFKVGDKTITIAELEEHVAAAAGITETVNQRLAALEAKTALMDAAVIDE